MDLNFDTNQTVIVAFIFTIVAISVATMFLSCFGKKKDKKKRSKKDKAPSPPPASSRSSPPPEEGTAKTEQPAVDEKPSSDVKVVDAEVEVDDLGDFSAVQRDAGILRSEINDESVLQLSYTSHQDEKDAHQTEPEVKPATASLEEKTVTSPSSDEFNTSQGRSSMLDDIEFTLANFDSNVEKEVKKEVPTVVHSGVIKTVEYTEKKVTSVAATPKRPMEEVAADTKQIENELQKNKDAFGGLLNAAGPATTRVEKTVKEEINERIVLPDTVKTVSTGFKEMTEKETISSITAEVQEEIQSETTSTVNTKTSKLNNAVTVEIEDKGSSLLNAFGKENTNEEKDVNGEKHGDKQAKPDSLLGTIENTAENIKARVTSAIEEVQATTMNKFGSVTADVKEDIGQKQTNNVEADVKEEGGAKINSTVNDLEKASSLLLNFTSSSSSSSLQSPSSPKTRAKIPPKVSPKPSPKLNIRPVLAKCDAISNSQDSNASKEEEMNSPKEQKEEMPASPTTPASPTSQINSLSKIPMSKKTSAIPKLSFGTPLSNKSSSVSPLSSPDASTASNKVGQIPNAVQKEEEQIIDKVKELVEKTTEDFRQNNRGLNGGRDSKEKSPEPEKNSSPFERESRGSKSRLTKLRYSGRKPADSKPADSRSDESGSERGSRAGSEAKSEDEKKMSEDASELDKSSRIPVRGGSKPRSSPPKALGE